MKKSPPIVVFLALLVVSVYWQVGRHGFINIDDEVYIIENPVVLRGLTLEGVSWAFTTFHPSTWHPLTWLSHMLDVELFGLSPGWHHRMGLLFHLLNTELLFFVLFRMTGVLWQSAFVAALFGVHPLHVESVAWVSERKDVLCAFFWILTTGAYLRYARRPGIGRYLLLTAAFASGLLCKAMTVTIPFVLLLLDFWPLGRIARSASPETPGKTLFRCAPRLALEKVPLLALSAVACVVAYLSQDSGGAVGSLDVLPLSQRIANASVSYVIYLVKTIWPSPLAAYYPHPGLTGPGYPAWKTAGGILLISGFSAIALREYLRRPCLAVGWLWYLGTLLPVIGLIQIGSQAYADRYTYIPHIGIFLAASWGIPSALPVFRFRRRLLGALAGAVLVAFSAVSWVQTGYWRDSIALLTHATAVTERNWYAWNNLGDCYNDIGRYRQAIGHIREALRIKRDYAEAWNNLGMSYSALGEYRQAIESYREALRLNPGHAEEWNNLGVACNGLGRNQEAIGYYREAVRINPVHFLSWNNMGISFFELGRYREAAASFEEALRIHPEYAESRKNLAATNRMLGRNR